MNGILPISIYCEEFGHQRFETEKQMLNFLKFDKGVKDLNIYAHNAKYDVASSAKGILSPQAACDGKHGRPRCQPCGAPERGARGPGGVRAWTSPRHAWALAYVRLVFYTLQ
jgi:hypothetical protein